MVSEVTLIPEIVATELRPVLLRLARELKFHYAANIEWEMDEKDPTEGVRQSFQYMKRVLLA